MQGWGSRGGWDTAGTHQLLGGVTGLPLAGSVLHLDTRGGGLQGW